MDVSDNSGTPKSSILIGFSIINHAFWGTPFFGNIHIWIPKMMFWKRWLLLNMAFSLGILTLSQGVSGKVRINLNPPF